MQASQSLFVKRAATSGEPSHETFRTAQVLGGDVSGIVEDSKAAEVTLPLPQGMLHRLQLATTRYYPISNSPVYLFLSDCTA